MQLINYLLYPISRLWRFQGCIIGYLKVQRCNETGTLPNTWGNPGPNSTETQWINYSNHIRNLSKEEQEKIDLILIDGRFRVACCLKCFDVIKSSCLIAFDDFLNRKNYHIVLDYYDIVWKTKDNRMVILKKKKNINSIPEDVIKKYELIRI